jgi:hypothetical protein
MAQGTHDDLPASDQSLSWRKAVMWLCRVDTIRRRSRLETTLSIPQAAMRTTPLAPRCLCWKANAARLTCRCFGLTASACVPIGHCFNREIVQ